MEPQDQIVRRTDAPELEDIRVIRSTIWRSEDERAHELTDGERIEVSMLPPTRSLVREFPVPGLERQYIRYLEQRILRRPRDLKTHVRRVLTLVELDDFEGATGALADLFIVLGEHGRPLRTRLVDTIESRLAPGHREFFRAHLESGLQPTEAIPTPESRLAKRATGTTEIVVTGDSPGGCGIEPARRYIAEGRDDIAQQMLEGLLDADPGDPELCDTLLDLYARNDARSDFFRVYTRFLGRPLAKLSRWQKVAADFQAAGVTDRRETELPDLAHLQ